MGMGHEIIMMSQVHGKEVRQKHRAGLCHTQRKLPCRELPCKSATAHAKGRFSCQRKPQQWLFECRTMGGRARHQFLHWRCRALREVVRFEIIRQNKPEIPRSSVETPLGPQDILHGQPVGSSRTTVRAQLGLGSRLQQMFRWVRSQALPGLKFPNIYPKADILSSNQSQHRLCYLQTGQKSVVGGS